MNKPTETTERPHFRQVLNFFKILDRIFNLNKSCLWSSDSEHPVGDFCSHAHTHTHSHIPRLRPSLSGGLIPPSTRLAAGQIVPESRFTLKRSICLSNDGHVKKKTGPCRHRQTSYCVRRPEGLLITYVCSEMTDFYVELNYRDRHVPQI